MRHLTKLFIAALALVASPAAAQTIAYEDVLFADTSVALLEQSAEPVAQAAPPAPRIAPAPQIAYETPVEYETARRAVTIWNRAPMIAAKIAGPKHKAARVDYGPFRVLGEGKVALAGLIDGRSPAQFAQLLRDHPEIGMLEMVEAPGTVDDNANFRLARMLRDHAIVTYVPAHGSVRSGAVELFLAGARRIAHRDAEFAVHSWMDIYGREASDFAASDPVNRAYIDFYVEMGIGEREAERFYAMTNSVPHYDALWLDTGDLARYVPIEQTS
jgi:hypothetical protein